MRTAGIVALTALAITVAACGGRPGTSSRIATTSAAGSATPATSTPAAAPSVTPPAIPPKPATLDGYAPAIAAYLTAGAPLPAQSCLGDLAIAWSMPYFSGERTCRIINADSDPDDEVAVVLAASGTPAGSTTFHVAVFDLATGGYRVSFQTPDAVLDTTAAGIGAGNMLGNVLLGGGDLIGDGAGALAYAIPACGASACSSTVHIVRLAAGGVQQLTPPGGITISSAGIAFRDAPGERAKELVLTGGTPGSVGAGPQRARTETWKWDGTVYVLADTTPAPAAYLYHAIKDADGLFAAGNWAGAEAAYVKAVDDKGLKLWKPDKNERNELESYALFRAGLAVLLAGGDGAKAASYFERGGAYENTLHAQLSRSFGGAYAAKREVSVGCAAVRQDLGANASEYAAFWDFGSSNPTFDPDSVCPS